MCKFAIIRTSNVQGFLYYLGGLAGISGVPPSSGTAIFMTPVWLYKQTLSSYLGDGFKTLTALLKALPLSLLLDTRIYYHLPTVLYRDTIVYRRGNRNLPARPSKMTGAAIENDRRGHRNLPARPSKMTGAAIETVVYIGHRK